MRFQSAPFNMDLNLDGKTTSIQLALVMGVATQEVDPQEQQLPVIKKVHSCGTCLCDTNQPCQAFCHGPTLSIQNLSDENIDVAKINVQRKLSYKEGMETEIEFKFDEVKHKVALKRHQQKIFEFYKDLKSYKPDWLNQSYNPSWPCDENYSKYPGDAVTFNFELDIEVYKLISI